MKKRLPVTREQMEFLKTLGVEDKEYTKEETYRIVSDVVADCLVMKGFDTYDPDYETNEIGDMCEDIIDVLTEKMW